MPAKLLLYYIDGKWGSGVAARVSKMIAALDCSVSLRDTGAGPSSYTMPLCLLYAFG